MKITGTLVDISEVPKKGHHSKFVEVLNSIPRGKAFKFEGAVNMRDLRGFLRRPHNKGNFLHLLTIQRNNIGYVVHKEDWEP